jgi:hypothetical protein
MRPTTRLPLLVAVVAGLVTGCASSDSPTPVATPNASAAAVEVCPRLDLRAPTGQRLDLGGRWLANDGGSYFLSQDESCLFWMGQSPPSGDVPAGGNWTNVFSGRILSSFVVAGPWSDVPAGAAASANHGTLTLGIDFFDLDSVTWPALVLQSQDPRDVFGGTAWQPEESLSAVDSFTGTIGIDEVGCASLEVAGQQYALVGEVFYTEGQHFFSDLGRPLVAAGAQARVEGQVATALGDAACPVSDQQLLVWDLSPAL